jgi:hypothetical protein
MNAQESDSDAAVGAQVVGSMVEGGVYYRRAAGPFTLSLRGAAGYAWFGDDRRFLTADAFDSSTSNWGGVFFDGHVGASYEVGFGRYYIRPEVSADYLRLDEGAHTDVGGGPGFDLVVADRDSTRFSGQAVMVLGTQWGRVSWLRAEISGGYRRRHHGQLRGRQSVYPPVGSRPGRLGHLRFRPEDRNAVFLCGSRRQRRPARRRTALRSEDRRAFIVLTRPRLARRLWGVSVSKCELAKQPRLAPRWRHE